MNYKIPQIPPSYNKYAGRENTWQYRQDKALWMQLVLAYCRPAPAKPYQKAIVAIEYHFKDKRRHDPDNYAGKFIMDGLVAAGIIADDSFDVVELYLRQGDPGGYTEVTVDEC